jgi:hypothetical protein
MSATRPPETLLNDLKDLKKSYRLPPSKHARPDERQEAMTAQQSSSNQRRHNRNDFKRQDHSR